VKPASEKLSKQDYCVELFAFCSILFNKRKGCQAMYCYFEYGDKVIEVFTSTPDNWLYLQYDNGQSFIVRSFSKRCTIVYRQLHVHPKYDILEK
jgi:hypothetical protein